MLNAYVVSVWMCQLWGDAAVWLAELGGEAQVGHVSGDWGELVLGAGDCRRSPDAGLIEVGGRPHAATSAISTTHTAHRNLMFRVASSILFCVLARSLCSYANVSFEPLL
jgi:hypothetical protein